MSTVLTMAVVRKLLVETVEALMGYARGRVLVETKTDRRPVDGLPYATIWFKNTELLPQNEGEYYDTDTAHIQFLDNESVITVQFSIWGDGAYDEALKLMHSLQASARFSDLWRVLGFAGIDSVQDISTQYGAKIQQRAYFNADFYVRLGREFPQDYFEISRWELHLPDKPYIEVLSLPISKGGFEFDVGLSRFDLINFI